MTVPQTAVEWRDLLRRRITESGLSLTEFAETVLLRERRTVARWLDGDSPIPQRVQEWLTDPQVAPWPEHVPGADP